MRDRWGLIAVALFGAAIAGTAKADSPLVAPPPSWTVDFSVDAVYATRGDLGHDPLLDSDPTHQLSQSNHPILSGNDFGFSWAPGADAQFKVNVGKVDFDARFLGGFDFTAKKSFTASAVAGTPTIPPIPLGGTADIDAVYGTQFNSGELNVSYDFDSRFAGFVGARSVWVKDSLDLSFHFNNQNADAPWNVSTFGVGPQIGSMVQVVRQGELTGPLSGLGVSVDGRVGYLWTSSDADFSATNDRAGPLFSAHGSFSGGTAVAEAGFKLLYRFWRNLNLEAGYRVVYLDAVPTAAGSVSATRVFDHAIDKNSDSLLIQGGTLGISAHF